MGNIASVNGKKPPGVMHNCYNTCPLNVYDQLYTPTRKAVQKVKIRINRTTLLRIRKLDVYLVTILRSKPRFTVEAYGLFIPSSSRAV